MSARLTSDFLRKSRQALSHSGIPEDQLRGTHGGLKSLLYDKLVQPGTIDRQIAGLLSKVETLRIGADYRSDDVDADTAAAIVRDAKTFVTAMEKQLHLDAVPGSAPKSKLDLDEGRK